MTEYFEVHERDGAARLGELRLESSHLTPCFTDSILVDTGSRWTTEHATPTGHDDRITVLPHRGFPSGTPTQIQDTFSIDYPTVEYPNAVVISTDTATDHEADVYILSDAQGIIDHAKAFTTSIRTVRNAIPADTALYLPGVATPLNLPTLAYAGVDLIDTDAAVLAGSQGRYLTVDSNLFLDDLEELPCTCPACQQPIESFTRSDCETHNVNALTAVLRTVRERIRAGRLRDYIEGQARNDGWLTATFRRFDQEWSYIEERTPIVRRATMTAATDDTLQRVEIRRFTNRLLSHYQNRFETPLVVVPCSARKPYSDSQSHKQFRQAIQYRAHVLSMSSPIGIVPQELELTYPAQHYDTPVTGRWSAEEITVVEKLFEEYLSRNEYPRVIAHVPTDGYGEICKRVADTVDVPFEYTVADHPTTTESLSALSDALATESAYAKRDREHHTVRAIADYQFGDGDEFFPEIHVEAPYPKYRVRNTNGDLLATLVPEYGVLALTLAGARQWQESGVSVKTVEIDEFVPRGSVLAPGIVDASSSIRIGDEVVIEGPQAFGVGRARMSGPEMQSSSRGIAVDVRHVTEH